MVRSLIDFFDDSFGVRFEGIGDDDKVIEL